MNERSTPVQAGDIPGTGPRRGLRPRHALVPLLAAGVALGGAALFTNPAQAAKPAAKPIATAVLESPRVGPVGVVRFFDRGRSTTVQVTVQVPENGATATRAFHGFHVHANSDAANGAGCIAEAKADEATWFVSADGHLKSEGENHAGHVGDMPSLLINADGRGEATFSTDRIEPLDLDGKAVILHAGADNFGNVPVGSAADQYSDNNPDAVAKTQATGNAGNRFACGVVRLG